MLAPLAWLFPVFCLSHAGATARVSPKRPALGIIRGMLAYLIRRLLYALPILIGVNLITFALFFIVNTPDDMARMQLGVKTVS